MFGWGIEPLVRAVVKNGGYHTMLPSLRRDYYTPMLDVDTPALTKAETLVVTHGL